VIELIQNKNGKIIIFSNWDSTFTAIRQVLKENGIEYVEINGSISERKENLHRFREGDVDVMFLNSKNNAFGTNLQETTHIILYHEMDINTLSQVFGRVRRIGRKEPLHVHQLV